MAPSPKRVKSPTGPLSSTPGTKSPKSTQNSQDPGASKAPARSDPDERISDWLMSTGLFYGPKPSSKRAASKKSKETDDKPRMSLDEIPDKAPNTVTHINKIFVGGVFDNWMKQDTYASASRNLPPPPETLSKPLTMFSPAKADPRKFSASQGPSAAAPALGSPADGNHEQDQEWVDDWDLRALFAARREGQRELNGIPVTRKYLNPRLNVQRDRAGPSFPRVPRTPLASINGFSAVDGEPLSGVKAPVLYNSRNRATDWPYDMYIPPCLSYRVGCICSACSSRATKSNVLEGVTCYVDVRYNDEDRSHWVRMEVSNHGAKVHKKFTKNVKLVIFKAGKVPTYIKARQLNVPIVSILWIQACKNAGGLVDTSPFIPNGIELYQKWMPVEQALGSFEGRLRPRERRWNVTSATNQQAKSAQKVSKGPKQIAGPSRCADKKSTGIDSGCDSISGKESNEGPPKRRKRKSALVALHKLMTKTKKRKETKLLLKPPKSSD